MCYVGTSQHNWEGEVGIGDLKGFGGNENGSANDLLNGWKIVSKNPAQSQPANLPHTSQTISPRFLLIETPSHRK